MAVNFIFSKDCDETHTMHLKADNVEIIIDNETDEIIEELFNFLLQRYQKNQWNEVNLSLVALIYCITNFIK